MTSKPTRLVSPTQKKGQHFEKCALNYLIKQGLMLLEHNYNTPCGELDLILKEEETIVFVEVRFRNNSNHGDAAESINYFKQKKIIKSAKLFLLNRGLYDKVLCRFDVLAINMVKGNLQYHWIKSAFY